ncbi:MAG: hypothetical protein GY817_01885 [bacterium]|nr:hypothetical protein [bacterium]
MTVIIDIMESKGLIKRMAAEADRRSYNLILTKKG